MRHIYRQIFLILIWLTSITAEAAELGFAKGSVVFGRPLDLSMQVKLDAPFDETSNCFSAEVFQGDNRFDAGRVRLDVISIANGVEATVRVRSVSAVNEPWAKVILRSNCGIKISRQYDFLTDFATDVPAGNMLVEALPTATSPNTLVTNNTETPISKLSGIRRLSKLSSQKSEPQSATAPLKSKNIKSISPPNSVAALDIKKSTQLVSEPVVQSRLRMETFELTDEHQILLKLSTALVAPSGMRTPEEIKALARATAVWRAINGITPEGGLALAPTNSMTQAQIKAPATETAVPSRIDVTPTAKGEKFPSLVSTSEFSNLLVYGLITLLAFTLACLAWLWLRLRKASLASYDWLNASSESYIEPTHEKTQFMTTSFHETQIDNQPVVHAYIEEIETINQSDLDVIHPPIEQTAATTLSDNKLASLASDTEEKQVRMQTARKKTKRTKPASNLTDIRPFITSAPPHFEAPRFDEIVLHNKNKSMESEQSKLVPSNAELLELVSKDTQPLHSQPKTVPNDKPFESPNQSIASTKAVPSNQDIKSNLIDFEIFAEPLNTDKRSRYVS